MVINLLGTCQVLYTFYVLVTSIILYRWHNVLPILQNPFSLVQSVRSLYILEKFMKFFGDFYFNLHMLLIVFIFRLFAFILVYYYMYHPRMNYRHPFLILQALFKE